MKLVKSLMRLQKKNKSNMKLVRSLMMSINIQYTTNLISPTDWHKNFSLGTGIHGIVDKIVRQNEKLQTVTLFCKILVVSKFKYIISQ